MHAAYIRVGAQQTLNNSEAKMESSNEQINPRLIRLIKAIGTETLTRRGICGNMDLRCRRSLWDHYIMPAREEGLVVMRYPDHPNSPDQAYRLTPKGLKLLEILNKENQ